MRSGACHKKASSVLLCTRLGVRQPRINARIPPDGQTATSKSREPTRGGGFGAIATCTFGPTSSANNNHIIKSTLFLLNKKKNRAHIGRNTNSYSIFSYPLSNEQGPSNPELFHVFCSRPAVLLLPGFACSWPTPALLLLLFLLDHLQHDDASRQPTTILFLVVPSCCL